MSQGLVSLVECGHVQDVSVRALRRLAVSLGAELRLELWFRGGELDRLVDEGHAALLGAVARRLDALGWETRLRCRSPCTGSAARSTWSRGTPQPAR